jgi:hypothetical protein
MPATEEEEWIYWDAKATELRRTQLETVRNSATKWSALLTALLGVFGAVAFSGGLTAIDKLNRASAFLARGLTTLAALAAVVGIFYFAKAAGGLTLKRTDSLGSDTLRTSYSESTKRGLRNIGIGKRAAFVAVGCVLAGSLVVLWSGEAKPLATPTYLLARVHGQLICGLLGEDERGVTIDRLPAAQAQVITVVQSCQSEPG